MPDIDIYQTFPPCAKGVAHFEGLTRYGIDLAALQRGGNLAFVTESLEEAMNAAKL